LALKMTVRDEDDVIVLALDGRMVLGEETTGFREKVKGLLAEGKKKIVLNVENVTEIDSSGLGAFVAAHRSAASQGALMRLCHLGAKFKETLQITKLLTVFDVSDTEIEAVRALSR
jgi:anti-sigma B factor antagonist